MTVEVRQSFVYQVAIRWCLEIGDFAARNFLRVGNKVYNLDTEGLFVGQKFNIKKAHRQLIFQSIDLKNYKKTLENWLKNTNWDLIETVISEKQIQRIKKNIVVARDNPRKVFNM
jgi:glutamate dehydrogenase/leucine dehydrogenase